MGLGVCFEHARETWIAVCWYSRDVPRTSLDLNKIATRVQKLLERGFAFSFRTVHPLCSHVVKRAFLRGVVDELKSVEANVQYTVEKL